MKKIRPIIVPFSHISLASKMARDNESLTLKPYHDTVGKLTIGYGRNLEDKGLTIAEAELLLANDVVEAHGELQSQFAFYRKLSEIRQAVMMDLYHNLGIGGLLTFKKMLRALQIGDFDEAATQLQDSKYYKQVGIRGQRNMLMIRFDKYFSREETRSYFKDQKG